MFLLWFKALHSSSRWKEKWSRVAKLLTYVKFCHQFLATNEVKNDQFPVRYTHMDSTSSKTISPIWRHLVGERNPLHVIWLAVLFSLYIAKISQSLVHIAQAQQAHCHGNMRTVIISTNNPIFMQPDFLQLVHYKSIYCTDATKERIYPMQQWNRRGMLHINTLCSI